MSAAASQRPPPRPAGRASGAPLPVIFYVTRRGLAMVCAGLLVALLGLLVVHAYARAYDPQDGWTRLILFGSEFNYESIPRLKRTPHYIESSEAGKWGYDGQFYAQLALDPSLRDPAFDQALDLPVYRARRIAVPAAAFVLGGGKPQSVLQAYALANGLGWCLLAAALYTLLRPATLRAGACLAAALLTFGVVASLQRALVDLPAAALLYAGIAAARWGRLPLLATALLTRETCLLGAGGFWKPIPPWHPGAWKNLLALALAATPLAAWMLYVEGRFGHHAAAGFGNFGWPLQAAVERFTQTCQQCSQLGWSKIFRHPLRLQWLYACPEVAELLTVASIFAQATFLILRRHWQSPTWRIGAGYLLLALILGSAVWEQSSAAARVLLPMTLAFYITLAGERTRWFWPAFLLGSLNLPYAVHTLWIV